MGCKLVQGDFKIRYVHIEEKYIIMNMLHGCRPPKADLSLIKYL